MKKLLFSLVWFLFISTTLNAQGPDYKPFSEWAWGIEDSTEYMLYTPTNLEIGKRYPIALFMHGCCGQDLHATARNAVDPPARMWHNFGANEQEVPTYIISAKTNRGWSKHFESLKKVIDFLVDKRQGDSTRIYVSGFSMGGRGTFEFISAYPDYFAAAMPMGMSFFDGDFDKIKDIPIWTNQGSKDWWSRELYKFVKETRSLNGLVLDSAWQWVRGVNPIYTSFEGVGHGVQWHAASTQDLTGWAYSKVNDGNKYPQVYFVTPGFREEAKKGKNYQVEISAEDPDGVISKVDLFVNKKFHASLSDAPYTTKIKPIAGDNLIEATAFDDKGKTNTASITLVVDTKPALKLESLPFARKGAYYGYWIPVDGNGELTFSATGVPKGLTLLKDGLLRGIPEESGRFEIETIIEDKDGDVTKGPVVLEVKEPRAGEVLVTNTSDANGSILPISKMIYNEDPTFNPGSEPSSFIEEINFSDLNKFYGLTFIKTDDNDSTPSGEDYLSFEVDRDVNVYVGYEKYDNALTSSIPDWLKDFEKEEDEVVAQFRYFGVYSKPYEKGKITLPGGDKKGNGMSFNYFVMVQPKEGLDTSPEINVSNLPSGTSGSYYSSTFTVLYGHGKLNWKLTEGNIPIGLELNKKGQISGIPEQKGSYNFKVEVADEKGQFAEALAKLIIE